ncbi:MAG: hypothetical protein KA956_12585 [Pyrinomonadaceae bacterium]|nr:hypothetical protein [Acidobacteriota bacterium]MBK7933709.1 hypothetical protein [Acidobacteriota bacterium]MBP7377304.1 hypothetical protein [Pyrinomonadaceae bacterium]
MKSIAGFVDTMSLSEAESQLQQLWMTRTIEERFLAVGGMYEAEKAILQRLAPENYSTKNLQEFVFFHMHGMTIDECINTVPDQIP